MDKIQIQMRYISYFILFSFVPGILFASVNDKNIFSVQYKSKKVILENENIKISNAFKIPLTIPALDDTGTWTLDTTISYSGLLGGKSGVFTKDIFLSVRGKVERLTWISNQKDVVGFRQTFINTSVNSIALHAMYPLWMEGDQKIFNNPANYRILVQKTLKNGKPAVVNPQKERTVISDPFLIIQDKDNKLLIGAQSFDLHLFNIRMDFSENKDRPVLQGLSAECNFEGVNVPPKGSRASQWVVLSQGEDGNRLITDYSERIQNYHDIEKPTGRPYSVYCTWYYHAEKYNEEIFNHDIATFGEEHMPFDVFLIDECWALDDWGDFEANEKFPSGMRWVADKIRSIGYIPGIWTPPFLVDSGTRLAGEHPEWLLKNSEGEFCRFNMNKKDHFILDPTYPGVSLYLEDSYRKLSRDWGFKYFKFDFMRAVFLDQGQQFYNKNTTSLEAYRMGLEAIRRGVGDDAYISVCGGHYGASIGLADSQRSGSDVKSMWNENEIPKYRQNILRTWMSAFWHVDPDAMMIRRQENALPTDKRNLTPGLFTNEEAFTNALNQFIGGNLISFTEDFAVIDEDRKALYRHVIPSVNSSSEPVDLFNERIPEIMITHIKPVCEQLEEWNILSVINWNEDTRDYEISLKETVLKELNGKCFLVYDFKEKKIAGIFNTGDSLIIQNLPPHQSKVYKIMPWNGDKMAFVGTDLHFSSGGVEISEIKSGNNWLTGKLDTPWDYPVHIVYVIPDEGGYIQKQTEVLPGQTRFFMD